MAALPSQRPRADRTLDRLYRRYAGDVYRYAYAILQNRADAEDVTQTTFLNAYRALERGERLSSPHNWLITIAHNVCRQRFRQSQRRPSEVEWQDGVAEALVADDEVPTGEEIRRALSFLPFNQRAALVLRELEGRSYAEIATTLELSTSAVETLLFRARRALREQLEGSLGCNEAELAISKQLDGRLPRAEKGALRAHLRECPECATFARRQRGQRSALRSFGSVPIPAALASLFGGGGTAASVVVAKAAALVTAAAVAGGVSYEAVHKALPHRRIAPPGPVHVVPAARAPAVSTHVPAPAVSTHVPAAAVNVVAVRPRALRSGQAEHRVSAGHRPWQAHHERHTVHVAGSPQRRLPSPGFLRSRERRHQGQLRQLVPPQGRQGGFGAPHAQEHRRASFPR